MSEESSNKDGNASDGSATVEVENANHAAEEAKSNEAKTANPSKKFPPGRFMQLPQAIRWGLIAPAIGLIVLVANLVRWHHEDTVGTQKASRQATIDAGHAAAEATANALSAEQLYQAQRSDIRGWISGPDALVVGTNNFWVHISIDGKRPIRYRRIRYEARPQLWGAPPTPLPEPNFDDEWQPGNPPDSFTVPQPIQIDLTKEEVASAEQMGTVKVGEEGSDTMCLRQQPITQIFVFATYRFSDGRCHRRTISGYYVPRVCGNMTSPVTPGPTPTRDLAACGPPTTEPEDEDNAHCEDKRPKLRIEIVATPAMRAPESKYKYYPK